MVLHKNSNITSGPVFRIYYNNRHYIFFFFLISITHNIWGNISWIFQFFMLQITHRYKDKYTNLLKQSFSPSRRAVIIITMSVVQIIIVLYRHAVVLYYFPKKIEKYFFLPRSSSMAAVVVWYVAVEQFTPTVRTHVIIYKFTIYYTHVITRRTRRTENIYCVRARRRYINIMLYQEEPYGCVRRARSSVCNNNASAEIYIISAYKYVYYYRLFIHAVYNIVNAAKGEKKIN